MSIENNSEMKVGIVGCGAIASPHGTTLIAARSEKATQLEKERIGEIELQLFDIDVRMAKNLNEKIELKAVIHDTNR